MGLVLITGGENEKDEAKQDFFHLIIVRNWCMFDFFMSSSDSIPAIKNLNLLLFK
jgi:hypothetical protein